MKAQPEQIEPKLKPTIKVSAIQKRPDVEMKQIADQTVLTGEHGEATIQEDPIFNETAIQEDPIVNDQQQIDKLEEEPTPEINDQLSEELQLEDEEATNSHEYEKINLSDSSEAPEWADTAISQGNP